MLVAESLGLRASRRAAALLLAAVSAGLAVPPSTAAAAADHPLLSRYAGSELMKQDVEEYGDYRLVVGRDADGALQGQTLEGKVTRSVYRNPPDRSTLEIFRNYQEALERAGAMVVWRCALDECGPAHARSAWSKFNGLFAAADGDPRYLAAKLGGGTAYVAVMVGRKRTQVDVIELAAMHTNLVTVDAKALGQALDRDGRVSVYGILFDPDKAEIKAESKAALDEIAKLLGERPKLSLWVVGHTDSQGTFDHNRDLSDRRARAVVEALVKRHKIDRSRLEGHGVGPLAPVATNATEAGRAKNRRVELVVR